MSEIPKNDKPTEPEDAMDESVLDKELDDLAGGMSCTGHTCMQFSNKPIVE